MSVRYVVNQPVVLSVVFTVAGVATDPTTVTLVVTDPAGTVATYTYSATITKTGTGAFSKTFTGTSLPGTYSFVWTGTGTAADVQDGTFTIFDDVPLPLYAQVDEVKRRLGDDQTVDDQQYQTACESVSAWIDEWCQDFFGKVTGTRTGEACNLYELDLFDAKIGSLVSVTSLKTDSAGDGTFEQTWDAGTHYQLLPLNPSNGRETKPYTKIRAVGSLFLPLAYTSYGARRDRVQITGTFGWPAIPAAVREAALILAVDTLKLKDTAFGYAGIQATGFVATAKQNPQALALLQPYRRYAAMVA